jgi:hypothetical protein
MKNRQTRVFRSFLSASILSLLAGLTPASAEQESQSGCSLASLKGTYGAYRTGTAPYGAVAAQGLYYFNGEGGWELTLNISRNGEISVDEFWDGGYAVNEDCTGTINDDAGRFVIVDGGKGFYLLSTLAASRCTRWAPGSTSDEPSSPGERGRSDSRSGGTEGPGAVENRSSMDRSPGGLARAACPIPPAPSGLAEPSVTARGAPSSETGSSPCA